MLELSLIFVIGLIGSPHCRACIGHACRLRSFPARDGGIRRQLGYNAGRILSYLLLGAVAGALGTLLLGASPSAGAAITPLEPRAVSLLTGGLMIFMAVQLLGPPWPMEVGSGAVVERLVGLAMRSRGWVGPMGLGIYSGLVPCPIVYALTALALRSADPGAGMGIMLAFGLGTVPPLVLVGLSGARLAPANSSRLAARVVLLLGIVVLIQGTFQPA